MESKLDLKALNANKNVRMRNYWINRLKGFEFNNYFQDNIRTGVIEEYTVVTTTIPAIVSEKLDQIANSLSAKRVILLAALGVLAKKCSSVNDVCAFVPVSNAGRLTTYNDIIPVRMNDFSEFNFPRLVACLSQNLSKDYENSTYSLRAILNLNSQDLQGISKVGLQIEEEQQFSGEDALNMELLFSFSFSSGLQLKLKYHQSKFSDNYIQRIAKLYISLLQRLLNNKQDVIKDIEIISPDEKKIIMEDFNNTSMPIPGDATILDLFKQQVKIQPDRVAVQFNYKTLTYRELDLKSNQVANYLRADFDCQQKVIGVLLDRSVELIVAIFGILKAGAIYLPISKSYPPDRIAYMLHDSAAQLVFVDEENVEIPGNIKAVTVNITSNAAEAPCNYAKPDGIAYIIYTSGSTGRPKGVLIKHVSMLNRLCWMQNKYELQPGDVILQKTPLVFDVSIWELFWWSMYGAKLVLAEPGAEKSPEQLCNLIQQEKITVLHFVPTMLNMLLVYLKEFNKGYSLHSIRHLFASGEELKVIDAQQFLDYYPQARVHNLYGPTEATVDVSYHEVLASTQYHSIPIGKPIDNTSLYIFSKEQQLQPIGIPGEIYIGGINVAVGYLNREELTSEKFVVNPLDSQSRLYRTGDLGKWLPNGEIEYLGRIDNQIKIRGNRIEIGEVEYVVTSFDKIKNGVVLAKEANGAFQLVAYLVTEAGFNENDLIAYMNAKLPDYMIPSSFIYVDQIPVTSNGKVDRTTLMQLKNVEHVNDVKPQTDLEILLFKYWSEILNKKEISINDNFFRIGGDSILSVKLIGTLNNHFNINLALANLYEHNTIKQLAAFIDEAGLMNGLDEYSRVEQELEIFEQQYLQKYSDPNIEAVYPMSDTEKYMCYSDKSRPEDLLYFKQNMQPVMYINFNVDVLQTAVDIMVNRHPILRTGFNVEEGAHIIYKNIKIGIDYRDLSNLDNAVQHSRITAYLEQSRKNHINPNNASLWRLIVYKLSEHHHELLFEFYGAMLDGWSMSAVIAELNELYSILVKQGNVSHQIQTPAYKDFIIQELINKNNKEVHNYWKKELMDCKKLKLNNNTGPKQFKSIRQKSSKELVINLEKIAAREGTTIKNILFAAYVYTMSLLSGETDVLVGLLSFNRPLKQNGERLLGCFVNELPVRIKIPETATWKQLIGLVDQKLSEFKKHDTISLAVINKIINGKEDFTNEYFDTVFNFIRWHLMEAMELQPMSESEVNRVEFDNFVRTSTSFNVNYNLNSERLLNMHEYATPYIDDATIELYTSIFDSILVKMIDNTNEIIEPDHLITC
jgi:tyrocidine synthetase-3